MTSSAPSPPAANVQAAPVKVVHSAESQWALVWREFKKRKLALASLGLIVCLITISVTAPFLADNRPLYYRGYNRFEYRESLRTLLAVMNNALEPPKSVKAAPKPSAAVPKTEAAPVKKGDPPAVVVARQFDLMEAHLPDDMAAELRTQRERAIALMEKIEPDKAADKETAAEVRKLRVDLRKRFDAPDVPLVIRTHWPVFASLDWGDAALIVFNASLLLVPVWLPVLRRLVPPELERTRVWTSYFLLLGLPVLCGALWKLQVPERLDRTHYKEGVAVGDPNALKAPVVYEDVAWPPIRYALDEQDLDRKYVRPALARYVPEALLGIWDDVPQEAGDASAKAGRYDGPNWLGTDGTGRDVLSRMIWGGRVSLSVGIVATLIELALGIFFGALAGYFRGWVDVVLSRIIEVVICFPSFFLILTIVAFVGPSVYNIMIVIGLTGWTGLARLVRGDFLRLSDQEFVLAAKALGYSPMRIIFRHILPNAMAPILVTATFAVAGAILIESGLSFLGLGITVPKPSWGGILSTGRDSIFRAPWIIYFPGLALFVTITAYNLVGEAFRDASDPRMRGRM